MPALRCDIFCKVIDNYGDIGVCWRLARQLAAEHGLAVRLWVDDLASFRQLAPGIDAAAAAQTLAGVTVRRWDPAADDAEPADIVIEAFACDPPAAYIASMAQRAQKPAWINLEYLTAESWAAGSHTLASPHPRLPLVKYFFFPGFTPETGGLIREAALLADLQACILEIRTQQALWSSMAVNPPAERVLKVSLFAYENAALPGLLEAWANGEREVFCAVTAGRHVPQVRAWATQYSLSPNLLGERAGERGLPQGALAAEAPLPLPLSPQAGRGEQNAPAATNFVEGAIGREAGICGQWPLQQSAQRVRLGNLTLAFLPFLAQADYDRLLATCDLNFVRGEDSFVRAQWAGRPLVWQIYQQIDAAHLPKLAAFLDLYCAGLSAAESAALRAFWQAWEDEANAGAHWPALLAALPALQLHATHWTENLVSQGDLASKLLIFCQNLLECAAFPKAVAGPSQD